MCPSLEFDFDPEHIDWDDPDILVAYDRVIHNTDKAVLYGFGRKMFWLPKSCHRVDSFNILAVDPRLTISVQEATDETTP